MSAEQTVSGSAGVVRTWVRRLQLTDFRNYLRLVLEVGPRPVVLTGPNGSGKTNLLEALSLLAQGQGLRQAAYSELSRMGSSAWAVAATVQTPLGSVDIGTGHSREAGERSGRLVRIDGQSQQGHSALATHVEMVWMTPAMDGLFVGSGSERRRFLDRLIHCFDPGYRTQLRHFERAMQQRNRLLAEGVRESVRFEGFERTMAETGVAIAATRAATVAELNVAILARRDRAAGAVFPWAELSLSGTIESALQTQPAIDVEDAYFERLGAGRDTDRAAGRTLEGPHRSDLLVGHGPKQVPARLCSTGEQKALLFGLVLAQADLVRQRRAGSAPILLLDEIVAHLDPVRRAALFGEIIALGTQAWMTGTDPEAFSSLQELAQFHRIEEAAIAPMACTRGDPV